LGEEAGCVHVLQLQVRRLHPCTNERLETFRQILKRVQKKSIPKENPWKASQSLSDLELGIHFGSSSTLGRTMNPAKIQILPF
jgi:hypothetical protein